MTSPHLLNEMVEILETKGKGLSVFHDGNKYMSIHIYVYMQIYITFIGSLISIMVHLIPASKGGIGGG